MTSGEDHSLNGAGSGEGTGTPLPADARYAEFARKNAAWSEQVKASIRKLRTAGSAPSSSRAS